MQKARRIGRKISIPAQFADKGSCLFEKHFFIHIFPMKNVKCNHVIPKKALKG